MAKARLACVSVGTGSVTGKASTEDAGRTASVTHADASAGAGALRADKQGAGHVPLYLGGQRARDTGHVTPGA